jgi:rsbT co-antagonist protein RsbR
MLRHQACGVPSDAIPRCVSPEHLARLNQKDCGMKNKSGIDELDSRELPLQWRRQPAPVPRLSRDASLSTSAGRSSAALLRKFVAHLRLNRTELGLDWVRRMAEGRFLATLTREEIRTEAGSLFDSYLELLDTGSVQAAQAWSRCLVERLLPRGVEIDELIGIVLLLRDVLERSLFGKCRLDFKSLDHVLDLYELTVIRSLALCFLGERERVRHRQEEAIREIPIPVLEVRDRLLILPLVGAIDSHRAAQLTDRLLREIRLDRARVVVVDITGVPTIDATVANHLAATVEASRLMGADVIITGLSSEIARTLVTIGVDLNKLNAFGDLQGAIEAAEKLLGYRVVFKDRTTAPASNSRATNCLHAGG